jgi:hypothetical protein
MTETDDDWNPNMVSFDEQEETDAEPLKEQVWHSVPEAPIDESQDWELADHIFVFMEQSLDINPFGGQHVMNHYKCRKCGTNMVIPPSETPTLDNYGMSCGEIIIEEIMGK